MATAVLVDGDFYLRRYRTLMGNQPPDRAAKDLHKMCLDHLRQGEQRRELFRIFFYDCPPLSKKVIHPLTEDQLDFSETDTANWRYSFHDEMKTLRKVALRMGYLNERNGHWTIKPEPLKQLLADEITPEEMTERDMFFEVRRKGIEIRMGLDIASMAYKNQVDQMILIAGESDFVPAAKLARREGIDFVLDPMWADIRPELHEHIDGLRSVIRRNPPNYQNRHEDRPPPRYNDNRFNPQPPQHRDAQHFEDDEEDYE